MILGAASSFDGSYNGLDPSDVTLTNQTVPNVAPTNILPGAQSTDEDTELTFSVATGNVISVTDADAGSSPIRVSLVVSDGTLTLSTLYGLSIVSGTNGTGAVMFDGSITAINAALDGLVFRPTTDFAGLTILLIGTNDLGNTGTGGAQGTTGSVNIMVSPVDDAPSITVNSLTIDEGGSVVLSNANLNSSDPDNNAAQLTYTVSNVKNGQFELVGSPGVAITTFTQAQLDEGHVRFVQNGGQAAPSYDVKVSDGSLSDGPRQASITYTSVSVGSTAIDDPVPTTNPPAGNTIPAPPPVVIAEVHPPTSGSAQAGLPPEVTPAVFVSYGGSTAPGQEAPTGSTPDGSSLSPEGQATTGTGAVPGPTLIEAARVAAARNVAVINQGASALWKAITGPIVMGLEGRRPDAMQGELAEAPESEASRVETLEKTLHASGLLGELDRLRDDV